MTEENSKCTVELETEPRLETETATNGGLKIGLVANYEDTDETRFLLTPEGCGLLTSAGMRVIMESGAATDISFPDTSYAEFGAQIVTRDEALQADIVLSYSPLRHEDVMKMRDGATLFCMMSHGILEGNVVDALLDKGITAGALDNMYSFNEEPVFANIIDEIDGRGAVIYAQEFLSYVGGGKGVLLAGVAGLNPCEVLVIGDGLVAWSAARAAMAAGAYVTLMNNDISALQLAGNYCDGKLNTVAIHPRVLFNKVKTADVILIGNCTRPFEFPKNLSVAVKDSVYVLNFNETKPSLSVPRTVAMALSNVMVNFFDEMAIKGGVEGMVATTPGVQNGIVSYHGKLTDKLVAAYVNKPCVDIKVMLAATN